MEVKITLKNVNAYNLSCLFINLQDNHIIMLNGNNKNMEILLSVMNTLLEIKLEITNCDTKMCK